jgi:hypothetical protein
MRVAAGVVKEAEIARQVEAIARRLAPDVVRIRYNLGEDWTGESSIFFRILLSDDASREERLEEVANRVESRLLEKLKPAELGLLAYFNFRSQSEQAILREEAWA